VSIYSDDGVEVNGKVDPVEIDYLGLKALAKELDRPITTLIMNFDNDPFYAGSPARRAWAE
jgi:hypothetical protein